MTQAEKRAAKAQHEADSFNAAYPVGTRVRYWTSLREGKGKESITETEARVLGGHTAVVWLAGVSACISLSHVQAEEASQ